MKTDWTYRLKLRNLQMLLNLEHTQNISRSASALHTTQPALSKWLKDLEADIGLPCFERHARGLRPTRYGKALIEHARRINAHLDAARDDLAAMREGGSGRIVIGTSGAAAGSAAPLAVLRLMERYPKAVVELVESPMERLLERLSAGEVDIAVGRSMPAHSDLGLTCEVLYVDPIQFIVRPEHPLLERKALDWDAVLSYRWIVWPKGTPIRESLDEALRVIGRSVPPLSIQSGTVTMNLSLLSNSDMVGLASRRDTLRFASWNVARVLAFSVPSSAEVVMYWRDDGDHRPMLAAMLRLLREAANAAD